jgi:Glycine/D-amino acid oxidases (deaminating)
MNLENIKHAFTNAANEEGESWQSRLVSNYTNSLVNSLKAPVNGAMQTANHTAATQFKELEYSPVKQETGLDWASSIAGQATGMAIEFAVLRKGAGALIGSASARAGVVDLAKSLSGRMMIGGTTGAFMGGVLTPVEAGTDFWQERGKQAGLNALAFGTMTGLSGAIEAAGAKTTSSVASSILGSRRFNNAVGGSVGGGFGSVGDDLVHGRSVDWSKAGKHSVEMALIGVGSQAIDRSISRLSGNRGIEGAKSPSTIELLTVENGSRYIDLSQHSSLKSHIVRAQAVERQVRSSWFDGVEDTKRFPTLQGANNKADVVVVGGGIAGLKAAEELAAGGYKVALLEGTRVASGTTARMAAMVQGLPDAGFSTLRKYGPETYRQMMDGLKDSKAAVNKQASETDSGYSPATSYKLSNWLTKRWVRKEAADLKEWEPKINFVEGEGSANFTPSNRGMVVIPGEGNLHPRKYALAIAGSGKFQVFEDSPVKGLTVGKPNEPIKVHTESGSVTADKVVFATGGPAPLFGHLNKHVWEAQAFASKARYGQKIDGNLIGSDDPRFSYWRQMDSDSVLFGGAGRLLSLQRAVPESNLLRRKLQQWLPGAQMENQWNGTIFISNDGMPIVAKHPGNPNLYSVTGLGGTGLVLSDMAAKALRQDLQSGANYLSDTRFNR